MCTACVSDTFRTRHGSPTMECPCYRDTMASKISKTTTNYCYACHKLQCFWNDKELNLEDRPWHVKLKFNFRRNTCTGMYMHFKRIPSKFLLDVVLIHHKSSFDLLINLICFLQIQLVLNKI